MRAVIQRVTKAECTIDGQLTSSIKKGFLILLGIKCGDTKDDCKYLADKCCGLRIFEDENEKLNLSLSDVGGKLLIISNFTLYGNCSHGRRPGFTNAARPGEAVPLYEYFIECCKNNGIDVETGTFGADMKISLVNDGPITLILDTDEMRK